MSNESFVRFVVGRARPARAASLSCPLTPRSAHGGAPSGYSAQDTLRSLGAATRTVPTGNAT